MVTSLVFIYEKLLLIADMWVIADLSHPYSKAESRLVIKNKVVKEQRVDGSSNSRNLDFVRCTLVAGKPVLGRKIHSHSDNSIIANNMFKRFMLTTRSSLDP
jgi:hypothetical protein